MFDIRSVFNSRQSTDKQVEVTVASTVSFTGSSPQSLRSLQRSSLLILPTFRPNVVLCVSYQSLSGSWHTDLDYGSYRLPELELGFTAGVTGLQGMLTPLRHLIPPLVYPEVFFVCPILKFVFPNGLMRLTVRYFMLVTNNFNWIGLLQWSYIGKTSHGVTLAASHFQMKDLISHLLFIIMYTCISIILW
jgi:hypothetical protein